MLHLVENVKSKVGIASLNISSNGGIEQGFSVSGKVTIWVKNGGVEQMVAIRHDEGDKKRLGISERAAAEEMREKCEERLWVLGNGSRCMNMKPLEEGDESGRVRRERLGGENREEECVIVEVGNVRFEVVELDLTGGEDSGYGLK